MSTLLTKTEQLPSFQDQATRVLQQLRTALAGLLAAIPGGVSRATDLEQALKIGTTPAWQIYRLATATEPLAAALHVPGPAPVRRLLDAARKQRVQAEVVDKVAAAFDDFEQFVKDSSGDRRSFESLVVGLSGSETESLNLQQRRAAFKANSHIWGLQIKARYGCTIIQPSDDPPFVDVVFVRGVVELRQLRHGRPFVISNTCITDNDDIIKRNVEIERLGVGSPTNGVNLLRDYCTSPLPEIRNRMDARGMLRTEMVNHDIGNGAAFTGFLCDIFRNGEVRYRDGDNRVAGIRSNINSPIEIGVMDVLVRAGTYADGPCDFRAEVWNAVGQQVAATDRDVMFTSGAIPCLGRGVEPLHSTDYPRYVEMLNFVMGRLGWDSDEFEAYRYRLAYPVMPSAMVMECDLPEKPA